LYNKRSNRPRNHPALRRSFLYALIKVGLIAREDLAERLAPLGFCPPHVIIMKVLAHSGPLTQARLGEEMGVDKASMVKFINGLERTGAVERVADPADARVRVIRLTPRGRVLLPRLRRIADRLEAECLSGLSAAERRTLHRIIPRILWKD
jgi:DNA-binding MarR family transcriptional regulator